MRALPAGLLAVLALAGCGSQTQEAQAPPPPQPAAVRPPVLPLRQNLPAQTVILTYHDFIEERDSKSVWFDCTVQEFRDQLDWMDKQGANFITIGQLEAWLTKGVDLPPRPVLLTFADNYLGFYRHAWPILRERRIPGVMFVHTGYVGSSVGRPKMAWSQLKELESLGQIMVASQTRTHPEDLTRLSEEQILKEFVQSRLDLEEGLGRPETRLAYPRGKFNDLCLRLAKEAGYTIAFTEEQEPAEKARSIFAIPRYVHTKMRQAFRDTE